MIVAIFSSKILFCLSISEYFPKKQGLRKFLKLTFNHMVSTAASNGQWLRLVLAPDSALDSSQSFKVNVSVVLLPLPLQKFATGQFTLFHFSINLNFP